MNQKNSDEVGISVFYDHYWDNFLQFSIKTYMYVEILMNTHIFTEKYGKSSLNYHQISTLCVSLGHCICIMKVHTLEDMELP